MKKIISIVVIAFILITTSFAATVTIISSGGRVSTTTPAGVEVTLLSSGLARWFKVVTGGINFEENTFIMPNVDVEIRAMNTGGLITVNQADGGTITPGTVGVEEGGSQTFTIAPNYGYVPMFNKL